MVSKAGILCFMLLVLAYYDKAVSVATVYNVNLDILYFGGWHLFAICVALIFAFERRIWQEKLLFYVVCFVFGFNLLQNVAALNHDYYQFKRVMNNFLIDHLKWVFQIGFIILFLWVVIKYRRT
jgi:hypothetical protein